MPSLYNDLEKLFQFQNVERVPELIQCDSEEQLTRSGAQEKPSDEVDASESDSDEDPQSVEGDCVSSIGNLIKTVNCGNAFIFLSATDQLIHAKK